MAKIISVRLSRALLTGLLLASFIPGHAQGPDDPLSAAWLASWSTSASGGMCQAAGGAPAAFAEPTSLGGEIGPGVGGTAISSFVASVEGSAIGPRPAPEICQAPPPATVEPASAPEDSIGRAAGNPVDVVTGNKYLRQVDVILAHPQSSSVSPAGIAEAFGLPQDDTLNLLFARHYNSRSEFSLSLGRGWSHSFDTRLARIVRAGRVQLQIVQADGRRIVFERDPASERRRVPAPADVVAPADKPRLVPDEPSTAGAGPGGANGAGTSNVGASSTRTRRYRTPTIADGLIDESIVHGEPVGFVWRWPRGQILRFDRDGRLVSIVSADLDRIDLRRDGQGRLVEARDRSGRDFHFEYDDRRLVALRLPDGQRIRYGYDAHHQLTSVSYPDGRRQRYEYEDARAWHWLTAVVDADGRRSAYSYGDDGRVIASRGIGERADETLHFSYALPARPGDQGRTTIRSGASTTHYQWRETNGVPMLLSSTGDGCRRCPPVGLSVRAGVAGQVVAIGALQIRRDALGRVVERRIDAAAGNPVWRERLEYAGGSSWPLPVRIVRSSVVAGRDVQIGIRYNERHQVVRLDFSGWLPDDAAPQPIRAALEFRYAWLTRTEEERAYFGRLHTLYRIGADGSRRRYGFRHDRLRRLISLEPTVTIVHRIERDTLGRPVMERLPDESVRRRSYDASWRIVRSSRRGVEASFVYDEFGRPREIGWSSGERWLIGLTGAGVEIASNHGWRESIAVARRPATHKPAPSAGKSAVDASGSGLMRGFALALAHERPGVRTLVDFGGQRHEWRHDDLGRLVQADSPQEGRKQYRYDAGGRLTSIVWADGSMDLREHDSFGRLERRTQRSGSEQFETQYTWIGSRLSAVTSYGHRMMALRDDDARRIERVEIRGDRVYREQFEFDAQGRVHAVRLADGTRLRYRHDETGRRIGLDLALAGSEHYRSLVRRAADGAEAGGSGPSADNPGEVWQLGNGIRFERRIDGRGRPTVMRWTRAQRIAGEPMSQPASAGASMLPFRRLHWDPAGVPLVIAHERGEDRYAYDRFGRLLVRERHVSTAAAGEAPAAGHVEYFALDALGRRVATRRRDGSESRMSESVASGSARRDARGLPTTHAGFPLRYGAQRRIVAVGSPHADAPDRVRYRYDAFGRRSEKEVVPAASAAAGAGTAPPRDAVKTGFLYRDQQLVAELDGEGRIVRQFIYWDGAPLAVLDHRAGATTVTWLLTDHLGAPIAATDESAQVVWRGDADAFGGVAAQEGSFVQPLRLPGQYFDAETGWHDNLLRTYDPATGRYLEPDPLGLRAGLDPHAYADGNPLVATDPFGLLLFAFDGTGNGATGMRGEDISNVRKFFETSADPDKWYMAGVGRDDEDSGIRTTAMDFASAETARPRVDWMLDRLDAALDARWIGRFAPVDVIGFSRGAAMARDFVNQVSRMIDEGVYFGRGICVDLRFLGLWDTVAQFGVLGSENDRWQLAIPSAVRATWHAVALNEHRALFPLESAAGGSAWIIERGFVGSHADVGGGNVDGDLSDVALVWMIEAARSLGVPLNDLAPRFTVVTDALLHDRRLSWSGDRSVAERDEDGRIRRTGAQRTERIGGLDWATSLEFINYFWRRRFDASGWPTIVGSVDMQAYGEWLARVYGIEVRPGPINLRPARSGDIDLSHR